MEKENGNGNDGGAVPKPSAAVGALARFKKK
jgi:hypothetical protein